MLVVCLPRLEFAYQLPQTSVMSTKDPVAFGEAVARRREELGLSQIDVWKKRGPSNTTLTVIENGRMADLTPATARKLDLGLDREDGAALRLWRNGTEPTPVWPGETRPPRDVGRRVLLGDPAHIADLHERVEELELRLSAVEKQLNQLQEGGGDDGKETSTEITEPPSGAGKKKSDYAKAARTGKPSLTERRQQHDEATERPPEDPTGMQSI